MVDPSAAPTAQRARRFWRKQEQTPGPPVADEAARDRIGALEARLTHLEQAFEGLQDAVYRQEMSHTRRMDELHKRTEPAEIARELSEDARRRGL